MLRQRHATSVAAGARACKGKAGARERGRASTDAEGECAGCRIRRPEQRDGAPLEEGENYLPEGASREPWKLLVVAAVAVAHVLFG
jgi:hypothetical protein